MKGNSSSEAMSEVLQEAEQRGYERCMNERLNKHVDLMSKVFWTGIYLGIGILLSCICPLDSILIRPDDLFFNVLPMVTYIILTICVWKTIEVWKL